MCQDENPGTMGLRVRPERRIASKSVSLLPQSGRLQLAPTALRDEAFSEVSVEDPVAFWRE
ncbi:MAG: hypothetical protein P8175_14810 [Deltaproteobacteria bacterium]